MSAYLVSESRTIGAPAQQLFDIVADPAMHARIDGSGSVRSVRAGGPQRLSQGAKFGMDMHIGANYKITNTVVEFEEGTRIAWRHFNGHVWRYRFTAVDGGTEVSEQWDLRPVWNRAILRLVFGRRTRVAIRRTLERLDELATSTAAA